MKNIYNFKKSLNDNSLKLNNESKLISNIIKIESVKNIFKKKLMMK